MSFITCDWSGTMPFRPSISPLSFATSVARSPAAAGATGPAGCAVPARAAPPASAATATKITTVLSHERMHSSRRLDRAWLLPGDKGHERAAACREHDDEPRRRLPEREQAEGRESETYIGRTPDRARPYRMIERSQEKPDDGRVDPSQRFLEAGPPADCGTEGECSDDQQERGQEDRHQGEAGAGDAVGPRSHDGAEVGGEGEERTWHSLGGAVAGYELLVGHPAGRDDLCLEQRKDDVASAKDQRPGAEKAVEDRKRLGPRELASDRQREQETEEQHEHGRAQAPPDGDRRSCGRRRDSARQESQPDQRRGGDDDDLRGSRRPDERADRRQERDRGTPAVGRERPRHPPDGERDHGHRGHLQSVQPTGIGDLEHPEAIGECDQRNGRGEREPEPRRHTAEQAGAGDADGDTDLTAGWAREELAERHEIDIRGLVEPLASSDVLFTEVADVRDRPAE